MYRYVFFFWAEGLGGGADGGGFFGLFVGVREGVGEAGGEGGEGERGGGYVVSYEWVGAFYACMDFWTQLCVPGLWGGAMGEVALL